MASTSVQNLDRTRAVHPRSRLARAELDPIHRVARPVQPGERHATRPERRGGRGQARPQVSGSVWPGRIGGHDGMSLRCSSASRPLRVSAPRTSWSSRPSPSQDLVPLCWCLFRHVRPSLPTFPSRPIRSARVDTHTPVTVVLPINHARKVTQQ
jgi:hypothetical protein